MPPTDNDPKFETLLEFLRDNRGFDFTGYKRNSLMRRARTRMSVHRLDDFDEYRAYLDAHPQEFTALFNTILINVTEFFRDPEAWETLRRDYLVPLVRSREDGRPIRVWSAGCASGQETYTIMMLLAEIMGVDRFREQVKVYATDVDQEALTQARLAVYEEADLQNLSAELRERYFEEAGGRWAFRADLRRMVIFGRHDLTRDAPISHLDLLVCRNALMYFNVDTQARIMTRFHFALRDQGLLFLGKAEMMRAHGSLFAPADIRSRIFQKVARTELRGQLLMLARPAPLGTDGRQRLTHDLHMRNAVLDSIDAAMLAVDAAGTLALANEAACTLFGILPAEIGRPFAELTVSYRPVELRSLIETVQTDRRLMELNNIEWTFPDGTLRNLDARLVPLLDETGALIGVSISFVEMTRYHRLQADLVATNQELETAFEELQSTNEELETTNEELQSTIEELETTNEELQSTNEELETMNEELQSTNEELETINLELSARTAELDHVNAYMGSILTSLRVGVAVLDREMNIRIWNRRAEDLWGVRADEVVGAAFQNLDIGLPVQQLKGPIRACIEEGSEYEEAVLEAVNRRGRRIQCRVACTPFLGEDRERRGVVVVMEEWDGREPGG